MFERLGRLAHTATALGVSLVLFLTVGLAGAAAAPQLAPGYTAVKAGMQAQPQWQRLLSSASLRPATTGVPWQALLTEFADKHPLRQLDAVNRYFNRIPYVDDSATYRTADYWAPPQEFVRRNAGDCEDYAIAKYVALRALGWRADDLLVVVIRDHKYRVNHAALAVQFDGRWHLLDNRAARVLSPNDVPFYQPIYAVNEHQLSVFVRNRPTQEAAARPHEAPAATARTSG